MTNRRVFRLKAGDIGRLKISEEPILSPGPGEVRIGTRAIGLNFADVFAILGLYSATPEGAFIPGLEFSGEVVQVGSEVSDFGVGDRVMGVTRFGAYASDITISTKYVIRIPEDWTCQEGAAYLVQLLTAYYGLSNLGALKSGYNVLIHSAAGGVGIWANRICKHFGAYTIGSVGSKAKLDFLKEEGYDASIVRNTKTFAQDLKHALNGKSLDLIMECIGGKIMKIGFEQLGQMGRHIVYGSAQYGDRTDRPNYFKLIPKYLMRPRLDPQNMIAENKSVMAFNLIYLFDHPELLRDTLKETEAMDLGKPIIGNQFQFEDIPEAIRLFQSGKTMGKVVVNI